MSLTYFLKSDETIDQLYEKLRVLVNRPAYVAGASNSEGSECLYREPGKNFFRTFGRLEMYLSKFKSKYCIERTKTNTHKFDLVPSDWIHLVYPLTSEERRVEETSYEDDNFKVLGLTCDFNRDRAVVYPDASEDIPNELRPFLSEYMRWGRGGRKNSLGIRFAVSQAIEAPLIQHKDWHLGEEFGAPYFNAITLEAPGWYNGTKRGGIQSVNRIGVVNREPGSCICCHGSSGESKHLAVVSHGPPVYPDGLICRTCLPNAMEQWRKLLGTWVPTNHEQEIT